jgi:hypothetical protein
MKRMEATVFYTGSVDGGITNRNELTKKRSDPIVLEADKALRSTTTTEGDFMDAIEDEDEEDVPSSQTYFPQANLEEFDADNSTPKKRRLKEPSPKNNRDPFTDSTFAVLSTPPSSPHSSIWTYMPNSSAATLTSPLSAL